MIVSQVRNSTISKLANWLHAEDKENGYFNSFKSAHDLAKALYDLNLQSLKEACDDYQDYILPFEFTNEVFSKDSKGRAQSFMSLCYFLWQCYGDKVKKTELYKKLNEFEVEIAKKLAFDWADRQGAIWD